MQNTMVRGGGRGKNSQPGKKNKKGEENKE